MKTSHLVPKCSSSHQSIIMPSCVWKAAAFNETHQKPAGCRAELFIGWRYHADFKTKWQEWDMKGIGCHQEDYNGGALLMTDRQHTTGENKNLWVRKVNLTWQQSTKVISEHLHRQQNGLELEEVTPDGKEDHYIAFTLVEMFWNENTTADMHCLWDLCAYFILPL